MLSRRDTGRSCTRSGVGSALQQVLSLACVARKIVELAPIFPRRDDELRRSFDDARHLAVDPSPALVRALVIAPLEKDRASRIGRGEKAPAVHLDLRIDLEQGQDSRSDVD